VTSDVITGVRGKPKRYGPGLSSGGEILMIDFHIVFLLSVKPVAMVFLPKSIRG
jgi:hypothetical protein